ncbi:hypothetical protein [Endozoicomonas atrinae]|uniref:hypothetical protein n=1 Tax=Endozoicomonas atrinae TaxID=1333660 RepID=UPI00082545CF|nr:hypothetical protein [Endozoicomonas atrinae]
MNDQPVLGQLKDNIPAFIKTLDQKSLLTLIANKGNQIFSTRRLLENIKERIDIENNELEAHLKQPPQDIAYLKEKIRAIPPILFNRKKAMIDRVDQLTALNAKTRDFFEKKDIIIKQLIENFEKQRQLLLEETKHYQAAMDG